MMAYFYTVVSIFALLLLYLWHVNRGMSTTPPNALKLTRRRWTPEEAREAYEKTRTSPTDVAKHLPPKQGRRYIVVGGSGLVGGWIVQHLLMRGQDPEAIRLLDLREPTQPMIIESKVQFIQTDVSSADAVNKAFTAPWPGSHISNLPITVIHTVAYIGFSERKKDFMPIYQAVNIDGTRHVLEAAKDIGTTCFIFTSSCAVGLQPPSYFLSPFSRWPADNFKVLSKPNEFDANLPLSAYTSCYTYSKAAAETLVLKANSSSLKTGCIRPGHAIYGHGVNNVSSCTYAYLVRGGAPSWFLDVVNTLVNAQNVSIGHLAYEAAILSGKDVSGRAYYVTDPGPPIFWADLYTVLSTLAHKDTPQHFPRIPPVSLLLLGYVVEAYSLLRARFLPTLPRLPSDLAMITPTMMHMTTTHAVYDNRPAREEIGYEPCLGTMEGLCLNMLDWNQKVEQGIIEKGGENGAVASANITVPVVPPVK